MILIGNGTGLAGLRSLLRERSRRGHGRNWLLFGERQRERDFYYRGEIEGWLSAGVLQRVDLAFSRDRHEREYVQHLVTRNAAAIREWTNDGAAIYICGSIEGMAPGVHAALEEILGGSGLDRLIDQGNYRRDIY